MIGISYIDSYFSEKNISVEEYFTKYTDTNETEINLFKANTGFSKISICQSSVREMLEQLVAKYLETTKRDVNDIKYLIYIGANNYIEDNICIPYYIQGKFHMKNTSVINLNQKCCSTLCAMEILNQSLECNKVSLILSANKFEDMSKRLKSFLMIGDGVGLLELKNKDYLYEIVDIEHHCLSAYDNTIQKGKEDRLYIVDRGVKVVKELIGRNDLMMQDIDWFVPQNISTVAYKNLYGKRLKIKSDKIFLDNVPCCGHMGDVDTIANIKTCLQSDPQTEWIVVYGMGSEYENYNYICVILHRIGK